MPLQVTQRSRKLAENIIRSYCSTPLPKSKIEYEYLLGSVLGAALEIVPSSMHEKAIRVITRKYQHNKYDFKKRQDIYFYIGQILSDIWRYRHLWVYSNEALKMKEQKSLSVYGQKRKEALHMRGLSLRRSLHSKALLKKEA